MRGDPCAAASPGCCRQLCLRCPEETGKRPRGTCFPRRHVRPGAVPGLGHKLCPSRGRAGRGLWAAGRAGLEKPTAWGLCPRLSPPGPSRHAGRGPLPPPWCSGRGRGPAAEREVGAQHQRCAGRAVALTVGMEALLGPSVESCPVGLPRQWVWMPCSPLPHPVGCDGVQVPWSWGAAARHRTVHKLTWPCVPAWGHPELPEGQKGLQQCPSLSAPRAGSQLHSLLAWPIHDSSAGVPMVGRALCRGVPPATPLQGQKLAANAWHGVCRGDPLPCLSVLIPHPA